MIRVGITTLLLVTAIAVLAAGAPRLQVDATTFDFGTVVRGYRYTHTFIVANVGSNTLTISSVQPLCSCTTASIASTTLAPGQSTELRITLDTSTLHTGLTTKNIVVRSDDATSRSTYLQIMATVVGSGQPYHLTTAELHGAFYVLIDLRDAEEFATGHLIGAINVPASQLTGWGHLPRETVLIFCDAGGESALHLASTVQRAGFEAYALRGGLLAWQEAYDSRYLTGPVGGTAVVASGTSPLEIDAATLNDLYYALVDLRGEERHNAGHLMGATRVPPETLLSWVAPLPSSTRIVLYSEDSSTSDQAVQILRSRGYNEAVSLLGGLDLWLEVEEDPAHPERSLILTASDYLI
ncbi:MAG: DUF1573 domain-containing protein [Candidatus Bipolaricaulota bacterium]|nr:MAG: DUF1573 domain-containing protein [Candidatus Bipolaricaulota bacterium]